MRGYVDLYTTFYYRTHLIQSINILNSLSMIDFILDSFVFFTTAYVCTTKCVFK